MAPGFKPRLFGGYAFSPCDVLLSENALPGGRLSTCKGWESRQSMGFPGQDVWRRAWMEQGPRAAGLPRCQAYELRDREVLKPAGTCPRWFQKALSDDSVGGRSRAGETKSMRTATRHCPAEMLRSRRKVVADPGDERGWRPEVFRKQSSQELVSEKKKKAGPGHGSLGAWAVETNSPNVPVSPHSDRGFLKLSIHPVAPVIGSLGSLFLSLYQIKLLLSGSWLLKHPVCPCHLHIPITHCHFPANEPTYLLSRASGQEPACAGGRDAVGKDTIHGVFRQGVPGPFSHLLPVLMD